VSAIIRTLLALVGTFCEGPLGLKGGQPFGLRAFRLARARFAPPRRVVEVAELTVLTLQAAPLHVNAQAWLALPLRMQRGAHRNRAT